MKAKKEYYKNFVNRRTRAKKLIYFSILLVTFCIVLYDSFINNLPFHYIIFFLIGRVMSLLLNKTQKVKMSKTDKKHTVERSIIGSIIVITVLLLRLILFPKILTELNIVFISDALFLLVAGWFSGRVNLLSKKIEEVVFSDFIKEDQKKTN